MATEAQVRANRLNAQKSTGPRTAEGKERAAQNALTHGLFAREGVIRGEDEDQFEEHRERLLGQLCPAGPLEEILAVRIVDLSWRLRRAVQDQSDAFVAMYDRQTAEGEEPGNAALPSGIGEKANREIGGPRAATVGRMILEDFGQSAVLERLLRYERRIESSLYRTLNELRRVHDQAVKADREDAVTLERWREEDWNARKARSFPFTPPAEVSPGPAGQTREIEFGNPEPPASVARGASIASASLSGQALLVAGNHGHDGDPKPGETGTPKANECVWEPTPALGGHPSRLTAGGGCPTWGTHAHATETPDGVTTNLPTAEAACHSHIPSFHHSGPRPDAPEYIMCETNPKDSSRWSVVGCRRENDGTNEANSRRSLKCDG